MPIAARPPGTGTRPPWWPLATALILGTVAALGCEPRDSGTDPGDGDGRLEACDPAPAACDGNQIVACTDGSIRRTDCGPDAYCNGGRCEPTSIVFPRDAGIHGERTEWWYYTGHLRDGDREWGFQVTIFQYDFTEMFGTPGLGWMCHVGIVDLDAGDHFHADTISLAPRTWSRDPIDLEVDFCHLELGGDGRDRIRGEIPTGKEKDGKATPWAFDLALEPRKRPARHGTDGIIPMADTGGTSWYYSFTRMEARGTLSTPGGDHAVTGQAWMDHQWGDFDMQDFRGWDWWSMQFEDGWEVMLFQFTDWDGVLSLKAGTLVAPDGTLTPLEGMDAFTITPRRTWTSPHSGGTYPLDWDIRIPQGDWRIAVVTSVDDQEMHNLAQNYWEGQTRLSGTAGERVLAGEGYTELTGYAVDALDPPR
ncbi:hypothetical protein KBD49_08265 [Myxococcota bacterium]|nr:hypothetical protein [Myxococcota bacterium]